jgi:carbamoyltransferase
MNILGISCFYHDAAAALVRDGELVAAAEEERFSRIKHDFAFPSRAIAFCLAQGGISPRDLDYVVFYEKPFVKFERILKTCLGTFPRSWRVFREAMIVWLKDKLWVRTLIRHEPGVDPSRILFSEHHLSHAASAFYCSPFRDAAILTVDGVGEWTTASYGVGRDTEISLLREIHFPHSLGMLYSAFTAYLGFEVNEGEYKVMGMAPYGRPRFLDEVSRLIRVASDGSFALDLDYFSYHYSPDRAYNRRFVELFGPPRPPSLHFFTRDTGFPSYFGPKPPDYERLAELNQRYADIAASIQRVTEETLLAMARHLQKETGLTRLCLAGGVALNSVANGRILRETEFEECYVHPAAGDGGGAVGAALYAYHAVLGKPRQFVMEHAAWGQAYGPGEIREFLDTRGIAYAEARTEDELVDRTAGLLAQGKVVGWFQGRMEWGPRALGQRSILADPRRADMKDIVNVKIKFREPYRPFAPSVLAERAGEFFALRDAPRHYPARFMLYVVDVLPGKAPVVPATTHVDGSARLQTVSAEWNPLYHRLIRRFGEATGVPVLLNTSFNLKGEPIVASPADAVKTFSASGMDALILGPFIVQKDSA